MHEGDRIRIDIDRGISFLPRLIQEGIGWAFKLWLQIIRVTSFLSALS